MKRIISVVGIIAAMLLIAGPANALTKVRTPLGPGDCDLTGFCSFTVHAHDLASHEVESDTFDSQGNLTRIDIHGNLISQLTNTSNGDSVTLNNSGPTTITFNDDGSLNIVQRGPSVSGDQGLLTGNPFLIYNTGRLVTRGIPNAQTGFTDFVSQTRSGNARDICALLA